MPKLAAVVVVLFALVTSQSGCSKPGTKASSWIAPGIGAMEIQDLNADGFDDCVIWMGHPTRTGLHVIDGKSGGHRHSFASVDGRSAVISGSHLIYVTLTVTYPFKTRERVTSPPQLALSDLRTGNLLASVDLPHGNPEFFLLGNDVLVHTPSGDLYASVAQGKIFPSAALYQTRAELVGAHRAPNENLALEQALERMGWAAPVAESGAQRAIKTERWWVVPRDRNYGHLAMLDAKSLVRGWEIDIGEGAIAELAAGDDLVGAVLRVEGRSDSLVLVDVAERSVAHRYQHE
jgi:hypothetical protein